MLRWRLGYGLVVASLLAPLWVFSCGGDDGDGGGSAPDGDAAQGGTDSGSTLTENGGEGWSSSDDGGPVEVQEGGIEVTDETGSFVCHETLCAGHLLECGDCVDNDEDGLIDSHDPECLGPCDNTEGPGLSSDVGGVSADACKVDCYFDFGNGPGNDDCNWDHRCDTLEPEGELCAYDESMLGGNKCPLEQSPLCAEICLPYTPNGCDCFGCCTFPELATAGEDGGPGYVWIGALDDDNVSTCTLADIDDPELCPACTPLDNCFNPCGPCEVCVGRPQPPPECFEQDAGVPEQRCPPGLDPCGLEGQEECSASYYCISGCCVPLVE
jgi:hypothetical protein